jgi:DNA-binding beta-propeller fold protein YncE
LKIPKLALCPAALVCCACPALLAEVAISGLLELPEDGITFYQARLLGAETQPEWHWSIVSGAGSIERDGLGAGRYRGPRTLVETLPVTLRAESADGVHSGQLVIRVSPNHEQAGPWIRHLAGLSRKSEARPGLPRGPQFGEITRAVWLGDWHPDVQLRGKWALVDRARHQLVTMQPDGYVQPWLGGKDEGEEGCFKDGKVAEARFKGPTDLAVWPRNDKAEAGAPWRALIADSSNHCLRLVRATAKGTRISTYAGKGTEHGCQDGTLAEARFCEPRGIAFGQDDAIYVADAGNGMVRKIHRGQVTVLAGRKQAFHERKQVDGRGAEACFWAPESLVVDPRNGNLYVSDFCAIRRITPDGTVTTVAGVLTEAPFHYGFEEWLGRAPQEGKAERLAGVPCLNHPAGLFLDGSLLYIADHGNDAVRILNIDTGRLVTVAAGHCSVTAIGEGAQRDLQAVKEVKDGRPWASGLLPAEFAHNPHAGGFATLANPNHVAFNPTGGCLIVQGGSTARGEASCILEMKRDPRGATGAPGSGVLEDKAERKSDAGPRREGPAGQPRRENPAGAAKPRSNPLRDYFTRRGILNARSLTTYWEAPRRRLEA